MNSRKIENEKALNQIKEMIHDLSVDVDTKENGFINYPTTNIDLLKNMIIDSDFSFGRFDENDNISAFLLAYPIDKLSWEILDKDPIIHYIKTHINYPKNGIYLDMIWIVKEMQWKNIGIHLIREIKTKARRYGYEYMIAPIVISPHINTISIKLVELEWLKYYDTIEDKWLTFGIYKYNLK